MRLSLIASLLALTALSTSALADDYSALLKAHKYAEADRLALSKLTSDKGDAAALVTRVKVILAQGSPSRIDEAAKLAEQCIASHPQEAECYLAQGNALGSKAMMAGIMSAMGYAGTIRDAFKKAVELDPKNLEARDALLQYYLQAPSIVGGGSGKAQALVADTAKVLPDGAKLMQARVLLDDDAYAKAEAQALSVNVAGNEALGDIQNNLLQNLGMNYMKAKQYNDAERVFREVQKRFPDEEGGLYGLARVTQERGKPADAIPLFEKSIAILPHAHSYYRMGQCLEASNDKARAIAAYEKALAFKPELNKKQREEAEDRLNTLKAKS